MQSTTTLSEVNRQLEQAGLPVLTVKDRERLLRRAPRGAIIDAVKRAHHDDDARSYLVNLFQRCGLMSGQPRTAQDLGDTFSLSAPPSSSAPGAQSRRDAKHQDRRAPDGMDTAGYNQVIISDDDAIFCIDALSHPIAGERGIVVKAASKGRDGRGQWSCGRSAVLIGDGLLAFAGTSLKVVCAHVEIRDAFYRDRWVAVRRGASGSIALDLSAEQNTQYYATASPRKQFEVNTLCVDLIRQGCQAVQKGDVRQLLEDYVIRKSEQSDPRIRVKLIG